MRAPVVRVFQKWDKKPAARPLAKGERPLDWVGSSKKDFLAFPEAVRDEMGNALGLAKFGGKHPSNKPWKGQGSGVLELVERRLKVAQQDYEARYGKRKN